MALKVGDGLDLLNQPIINVASPSNPTDAVTKAYVDNVAAGASAKPSVRAATTANITLSGTQTVDGVAVVANDRVLVKNETTASGNGIYVCAAGAWVLAPDSIQGELTAGAYLTVTEGTVNADTMWQLTTNNPITVGTTSQVWSLYAPGSTSILAGNGISVTAGTVAVVPKSGGGVIVDGTGVSVDPAAATSKLKYAANVPATTNPSVMAHGLGTADLSITIYEISTGNVVLANPKADATNITIPWGSAPTAAQYRVVALG